MAQFPRVVSYMITVRLPCFFMVIAINAVGTPLQSRQEEIRNATGRLAVVAHDDGGWA